MGEAQNNWSKSTVPGAAYLLGHVQSPVVLKKLSACKIDSYMPDEAEDVDYIIENIWIVGDPQKCADRIRKLYEQVGGFGSLLAITQGPEDPQ